MAVHAADDPFDLDRFVVAQDDGGCYRSAVGEIRRGNKTGHWMWFVFPQIAALGKSATSIRYAISSLDEARAYLRHPVLGARLIECADAVAGVSDRSAEQIFGAVDAQKLHSSMTLFMRAAPGEVVFENVLIQYFDGVPDRGTDERLELTNR